MGGTDYFDQLRSYYRTTVKIKVWQTRIFTHFLMVAAVNAHIIYKLENNLKRGDKAYELLDFLGILVDQLCIPRLEKKPKDDEYPRRFNGKMHLPMLYKMQELKTAYQLKIDGHVSIRAESVLASIVELV